jgi:hypothetical protein
VDQRIGDPRVQDRQDTHGVPAEQSAEGLPSAKHYRTPAESLDRRFQLLAPVRCIARNDQEADLLSSERFPDRVRPDGNVSGSCRSEHEPLAATLILAPGQLPERRRVRRDRTA